MRSRCVIALAAAVTLVGCAPKNDGSQDKQTALAKTPTELAAYAGHTAYPATMPASNDLRAAAIIGSKGDVLKIYNFSSTPLRNVDVWVNGAYVQHVDGIPAQQNSVSIKTEDLYNGLGKSFASQKEPVSRVQIRTMDGFYNVMGPAAE